MTRILIVALVMSWSGSLLPLPQTEVDKTLSKVAGQAITQSDVFRARALKLTTAADNDDAVQVALENRKLVLLETSRPNQPVATAADRSARRRAWEAQFGGAPAAAARQAEVGMSETALNAWFDDDVKIERYQEQLFSGVPDRAEKIGKWIEDLRRRAGLRVRL